tara:strand:- start:1696 stop:1896 length:201 start_codon:yes stop_codon:yes gene_type:complete
MNEVINVERIVCFLKETADKKCKRYGPKNWCVINSNGERQLGSVKTSKMEKIYLDWFWETSNNIKK